MLDEAKLYKEVERAVIWGEPREEAYRIMAEAGLAGKPADMLYARLMAERVAMIRAAAMGDMCKGALMLAGGVVIFCIFWFVLGWILKVILYGSGVLALWGTWLMINGFANWLMAARKQGSLV